MEDESIVPYRCTTIVYYTWKIFTCLFTHVILVTTVVAYCLLGAKTFESLEKENEIAVKNNISVMRGKVADYIWDVTQNMPVLHEQNWSEIVFRRLKVFEDDLIVAIRKEGWDGIEDTGTLQWTFTGALFYSIIVITTIGYGHIAPKTVLGKVTTIFYAILGIPLMLLCLSNIGDIMAHSFRFLYWRICCYACTRPPKRTQRRSRRGTVRSHGGRSSWRSRTASASFKRSGRTSQRSADSALGSQSLVHSYSDTDCRYFHESEREVASLGRRGINRQSARHAGTALNMEPVQTPPMNIKNSFDRHGKGMGQSDVGQTDLPVLFNKYALDREESQRVHQKSLSREGRLLQRGHSAAPDLESGKNGVSGGKNHLAVGLPSESHSSTIPRRSRSQGRQLQEPYQQSPSPRIMSPMGFAVQRQTYLRQREMDYEYSDCDDSPPTKPVPIWLCVFLVVSYIIGGTFLFSGWEKWNYADSAYFCFITLTTIGFGDFVPAQRDKKDPEISIALCSLYLLFGISLLAMSFNLVQEEVISNVKAVARHLGILKDKNEEEDDDDDEGLD